MRQVVLDASVVLKWFSSSAAARALRAEYERGELVVVAPKRLPVDVLAEVAGATDWPAERLSRVGSELGRLGFELREASLTEIATWLARGLAPDRAAYAALASSLDLPLLTDDPELLGRAASIASPASDA